jgi:hypothetical protein
MKRMFVLGLLALPAFVAADSKALAQGCGIPGSNCGGGVLGLGFIGHNNAWEGCGGFCFRFLGGIHQHGPLYNYGPYAGYYPFAPYGPWDANLNWVGPYPPQGACGWNNLWGNRGHHGGGCGTGDCGHARGGLIGRGSNDRGGCNDCASRDYSLTTFKNVGRRVSPLSHWGKGKSSCEGGCASVDTKPANDVVQTGFPRTER